MAMNIHTSRAKILVLQEAMEMIRLHCDEALKKNGNGKLPYKETVKTLQCIKAIAEKFED